MYIEIDNVCLVLRSLGYILLIVQSHSLTRHKKKAVTQNSIMLSLMTKKNISGVAKNLNTLNILCQTLKGKQNT